MAHPNHDGRDDNNTRAAVQVGVSCTRADVAEGHTRADVQVGVSHARADIAEVDVHVSNLKYISSEIHLPSHLKYISHLI